MPSHIKLYGSKAERFESIKQDLTDALGYEPSNPEVVGILMSGYDVQGGSSASALLSPGNSRH